MPDRSPTEDFVGRRAELLVFERALDDARKGLAADNTRPAIAAVIIPRHIPRGLHRTWIPSTHQ